MISVTCRRPFSELGDQQLLDQTRRLAANQCCIEVHILDHLDEIDRRGLALRRGFSSLFDYAVRELRFTDAAAQRRIQTMRLCRRHGWVRAMLQSGELNLTSAAQLETTFAGAERAERQCRTGRRNDGQGRCHEQEQWARPLRDAGDQDDEAGEGAESGQSLGKRPREAGGLDAGERMASAMATAAPGANGAVAVGQPMAFSRRSAPAGAQPAGRLDVGAATGSAAPLAAPGRTPRAEQCSGDAVAAHAPPVAPAGAQDRGARHALPAGGGGTTVVPVAAQDRGIGHASTLRPQQRSGPGGDGGCDASRPATELNGADDGPAPEHVPPTIRSAQAPEPVAAPAESLRAASRAPESSRDDPFAELSPGPLSAAPLLHPQRQRELIEQAAGMSTRQVAGLLAAAAPEVVPPRDTLRAVAPDRYTLKVTIDQECEQGLRLLKGLLSHLDPRMSWGATWWRAWCARRWRGTTRSVAEAGRGGGEVRAARAHHRGGRRTGHVPPGRRRPRLSAEEAILRRRMVTARLPEGRTRSLWWPTLLHRVRQRPLHCQMAFHRLRTTVLRRRSSRPAPRRMAPMPAPPCRSRRSPLRRRSRHLAWPLAADRAAQQPEQRAALRRMAPMSPLACRSRRSPLRRQSRCAACPLTADRAAQQPEQWAAPRRLAPMPVPPCRSRRSPLRRRSWHSAYPLTADRRAHQPGQRRTRPAILSTAPTNPRLGATFPRLSGATSGNATEGAVVIAIRSPGAAAPLPICCRSTTCCRSPKAVARSRSTSICCAQLTTECATATDRLRRRSARCSACSALLLRRSTPLADGLQVARRDTLRSAAHRACIFAAASSGPGWSLLMASCKALSWSTVNEFLPLPAFGPFGPQQFSVSESGIDAG